jgi:negative regulator of flagellin synthesis FlgM
MKINGQRSDALRPTVSTPAGGVQGTPADAPKTQPTGGAPATARRSDSVQISDAGRALSGASGSLSPDRVAELRKKVLEGAYNSTHVVDQVAKRILERGDV